MKVYVVRYYNKISGEMENYGVFGSKEKAAEFCNKANENFPKSVTHWVEYELE